jgi:6-phosphogluconolactonase
MHPNGRVLYAVNEVAELDGEPTGSVSEFAVDPSSGAVSFARQVASGGKGPCHVSVDHVRHLLFVASYTTGSVTSFALQKDGAIGIRRSIVHHEGKGADPQRQAGPHAHCTLADARHPRLIVADLGIDALMIHGLDDMGVISSDATRIAMKPGAGPRHIVLHRNGRFLYVVNELDSTLVVFDYDGARGSLTELQSTPASPDGTATANHPAELLFSSAGDHLYVSNRGDDTIAVFAVDADTGRVIPVQHIGCGGKSPRHLALDPTGRVLVVANQRSDSLTSLLVDRKTARLTPTGSRADLPFPTCVRFVRGVQGV